MNHWGKSGRGCGSGFDRGTDLGHRAATTTATSTATGTDIAAATEEGVQTAIVIEQLIESRTTPVRAQGSCGALIARDTIRDACAVPAHRERQAQGRSSAHAAERNAGGRPRARNRMIPYLLAQRCVKNRFARSHVLVPQHHCPQMVRFSPPRLPPSFSP